VRLEKILDVRKFEKSGTSEKDRVSVVLFPSQFPNDLDKQTTFDDRIDDAAFNAAVIRFKRDINRTITLPKKITVSDFFYNPTVYALRKAGFRVLGPGDIGYDQASPVGISIESFWSWVHMSGVEMAISYKYNATLKINFDGKIKNIPLNGVSEKTDIVTISGQDDIDALQMIMKDYESKLESELRRAKGA